MVLEAELVSILTDHYCWGDMISVFFVNPDRQVIAKGELSLEKNRENSFISGLHTSPEYRERGHATDMLATLERASRYNGRCTVELETEAGDNYAQRFYEKRGYKKVPELTYSTEYGTYFTYRKVMDKIEGEI